MGKCCFYFRTRWQFPAIPPTSVSERFSRPLWWATSATHKQNTNSKTRLLRSLKVWYPIHTPTTQKLWRAATMDDVWINQDPFRQPHFLPLSIPRQRSLLLDEHHASSDFHDGRSAVPRLQQNREFLMAVLSIAIDIVDEVLAIDARYAQNVDNLDGLCQSEPSCQWGILEVEVKDLFAEAIWLSWHVKSMQKILKHSNPQQVNQQREKT